MEYNPSWFLGQPSLWELIKQDEEENHIGMNVIGLNYWIYDETCARIWWNLTDHECENTPRWCFPSYEDITEWLTQMGYTSDKYGDQDPDEWEGC